MKYVIDYSEYGDKTEFGSLEQAQTTIDELSRDWDCGKITLSVSGDKIVNDDGDKIGYISKTDKPWVVCEHERGTARCKFLAKYETEEEAMRDYETRKDQYEPESSCYLAVFNLDELNNS